MTTTSHAALFDDPASHGAASRVAIVGYGLIGGSIALAVHARGPAAQVRVWDPQEAARTVAAGQLGGACVAHSLQAAVEDADLVLITVPTAAFASVLREVIAHAKPTAVLSDVASVKGAIVEIVRDLPGAQRARFVPAHPIAGSEQSGAQHANGQLFTGQQVILTPIEGTAAGHVDGMRRFWQGIGSRVSMMSPEAHDEVFSAVSHLPHLIAFAYLGALAGSDAGHDYAGMAGPGFRDFTRIAGANPSLWADICVSNRRALLGDLHHFKNHLELLCDALSQGDRAGLSASFGAAKELRLAYERHTHLQAARERSSDLPAE
ncbi:MAG: prephenate dehydrogenase/arogenate dehydrogenase family protein [Ottowia sp.]|uniref:prephenate dehydrogenase n=1 Tax=Ottowia sp. TaxID=1898956 RepID=UPI0039E362E1